MCPSSERGGGGGGIVVLWRHAPPPLTSPPKIYRATSTSVNRSTGAQARNNLTPRLGAHDHQLREIPPARRVINESDVARAVLPPVRSDKFVTPQRVTGSRDFALFSRDSGVA